MSIADLLGAAKETDFVKKSLPVATYLAQIVEAESLYYYWKPNAKRPQPVFGISYVPTLHLVDIIETGDEELDTANQEQLELFGDWRNYNMRAVQGQEVPGFNEKVLCAGISPVNFDLIHATPGWEAVKEFSPQLWRFYSIKDGAYAGFVSDLSKQSDTFELIDLPPLNTEPGQILPLAIPMTVGAYLEITLKNEVDPNGQYPDKTVIDTYFAVA